MLPQEQIKERLSKRIIQAIANSNGFEAESFENDWGIDLRIKKIIARIKPDGKLRYQDSTQGINVQLKATTKKNIINSNGYISYKLKVDNYNDMVKIGRAHV